MAHMSYYIYIYYMLYIYIYIYVYLCVYIYVYIGTQGLYYGHFFSTPGYIIVHRNYIT